MRIFRLLSYYNTFLDTAYNTCGFHSISFYFFTNIFVRGKSALLRCPIKSSGLRFPSILSTAATHSGRCIRHWRRSPRSPYFTNYDAIICKRGRFIPQDLLLSFLCANNNRFSLFFLSLFDIFRQLSYNDFGYFIQY